MTYIHLHEYCSGGSGIVLGGIDTLVLNSNLYGQYMRVLEESPYSIIIIIRNVSCRGEREGLEWGKDIIDHVDFA